MLINVPLNGIFSIPLAPEFLPILLDIGLYQINHFNFEFCTGAKLNEYDGIDNWDKAEIEENRNYVSQYGVCDSPEQFLLQLGDFLNKDSRKFCVSFTEINKSERNSEGDWRWHKWGPYIGVQEPTTEYIYDEPVIERVYCYHIYEVLE